MFRSRWAELVRNFLHGVNAPDRAHLASLLTPFPSLCSGRYAVIRFNQYFKVKPQVSALEMPK